MLIFSVCWRVTPSGVNSLVDLIHFGMIFFEYKMLSPSQYTVNFMPTAIFCTLQVIQTDININ